MTNETKKNILLIDPDISSSKDLSDRLTGIGFNVLCANSEDMSLKLLQISKPDIILVDISMKLKKYTNIMSAITSNNELKNVPVIIISSNIDVTSKVRGFLSGANDYIVKPFGFHEILARINTQLRILNMQKQLEEKNKELLRKNELLQNLAVTDSLTNLYNKTYILTRLENELPHSIRYGEPLSFIMIDIDHFKRINDTYGHIIGDVVLKKISEHLACSLRETDIATRYGGEEFLIICPNTDLHGAKILSERIRKKILLNPILLGEHIINITISIGINNIVPKWPIDKFIKIEKLISDADCALYKAKHKGRNRVEIFEDVCFLNSPEPIILTNQEVPN